MYLGRGSKEEGAGNMRDGEGCPHSSKRVRARARHLSIIVHSCKSEIFWEGSKGTVLTSGSRCECTWAGYARKRELAT